MTRSLLIVAICTMLAAGTAFGQAREKPVAVGEMAPDFVLPDQNGQKRSLSAERGKRPVVLVFYRGHW
jgi:hypothetical protein